MPPTAASVAIPAPIPGTWTYLIDPSQADAIVPGSRVIVPVRSRRVVGVVTRIDPPLEEGRSYRSILGAPDAVPSIPAALLETCLWMGDYYACGPGPALRAALPVLLTEPTEPVPRTPTRKLLRISRPLETITERDEVFRRAPKQRSAWELLESLGGQAPVAHLEQQLGISHSVISALVHRGLVVMDREVWSRDAFASRDIPPLRNPVPTPAQAQAIETLSRGDSGEVFLLHGVTGSGKTLVYIELLREVVIRQGRTAMVLVPEIALTPQTVDRFRAAFGARIAVLHSGLSDGERMDAWRAIRNGERQIVVGARSAVFAPLENVGAIIVDEEHESSYKQGEAPRYHARDVAIVRARQERAVVVLGSATPSLESWANAGRGVYHLLSLPDRVGGGALPTVHVVDLRQRPSGGPVDPFRRVISEPLERGIVESLDRGEQAILLLNRRGFSSFLQCGACGQVSICPDCSISLTVHRAPERMVCHYCGHAEPIPVSCSRCGEATSREFGLGTQQVERLLGERFPRARIARMDVDTTSAKWSHARILDRVGRGEVDILLGTQMIAKGLDFPNVTLVGVVDADVGINLPDFRATERSFQLMAQVAGRAGRGPRGGVVFIQTRLPDNHGVRAAVKHDFVGFARQEIEDRKSPPYPPHVRLANVVFSGTDQDATAVLAVRGAQYLKQLISGGRAGSVEVVGPAPCAIERIKSRWRWHVLIRTARSSELTRVVRYFASHFEPESRSGLRVAIDRDPVALL